MWRTDNNLVSRSAVDPGVQGARSFLVEGGYAFYIGDLLVELSIDLGCQVRDGYAGLGFVVRIHIPLKRIQV